MSQDQELQALMRLEEDELARYCQSIEITGEIAQCVSLSLKQGQALWASRGSLLAYTDDVEWELKIPGGAGKALGRMMAGEGLSLTYVRPTKPTNKIVLTANKPGKLATWDLSRGAIVCTSGAFVGAVGDVDITVTTAKRAGAAIFGSAGLFLQKLSGTGIAIVHGSGDFVQHKLGPGEKILVSSGNLALFSEGTDYNVRGVGGCRKSFFGGEGLFMTELTGPGWVMLQTLKNLPVAQGQPR